MISINLWSLHHDLTRYRMMSFGVLIIRPFWVTDFVWKGAQWIEEDSSTAGVSRLSFVFTPKAGTEHQMKICKLKFKFKFPAGSFSLDFVLFCFVLYWFNFKRFFSHTWESVRGKRWGRDRIMSLYGLTKDMTRDNYRGQRVNDEFLLIDVP